MALERSATGNDAALSRPCPPRLEKVWMEDWCGAFLQIARPPKLLRGGVG